ncbi:MAG: hypothetical protein ACRDUX_33820 [Mycobacterium sp.]
MTNFAPIEPDAATSDAVELLTQVKTALGTTPNMAKGMANSPTLLKKKLLDTVGRSG